VDRFRFPQCFRFPRCFQKPGNQRNPAFFPHIVTFVNFSSVNPIKCRGIADQLASDALPIVLQRFFLQPARIFGKQDPIPDFFYDSLH
jgi:hypothetical protein